MPRVLVVGSGGREHALAWKLAQEAEVWATPGNPGIAQVAAETFDVAAGDAVRLAELAERGKVDLVVIGPEDPLIAGVADSLRKRGMAVFGPNREDARLEGSKAFAKDLMKRTGVPTADFETFRDPILALDYARSRFAKGLGVAVKASGAALGKGVVVCATLGEAEDAIGMMLVERELGPAGEEIVIEDRLQGREFSLMTLVSGREYVSLPAAQDYKRALDGDRGPNTGGMGSVCPAPGVSEALLREVERTAVGPILAELDDFRGVLFSGLMVDGGRAYCLEYNVRFGDPETQSIVRLLGAGFYDALHACAIGSPIPPVDVLPGASVSVVVASGGYPGSYPKGKPIVLGKMPDGVEVFIAGAAQTDAGLVTAGGRVLCLSARAATTPEARALAYEGVQQVRFEGAYCRTDIAS